jgi:hypothetical protein
MPYVDPARTKKEGNVKGLLVVLALAAGLVFPATGSAHVHGITPLLGLSCHVDNTITGANRTDSTPAAAANGGPISGLIPSTVGEASLMPGDGGFGATTANC